MGSSLNSRASCSAATGSNPPLKETVSCACVSSCACTASVASSVSKATCIGGSASQRTAGLSSAITGSKRAKLGSACSVVASASADRVHCGASGAGAVDASNTSDGAAAAALARAASGSGSKVKSGNDGGTLPGGGALGVTGTAIGSTDGASHCVNSIGSAATGRASAVVSGWAALASGNGQ